MENPNFFAKSFTKLRDLNKKSVNIFSPTSIQIFLAQQKFVFWYQQPYYQL